MKTVTESFLEIAPGGRDRYYWRDLWNSRELLGVLAWRDIAIRYKQTAVGLLWAFVQPIATMIVFTIVFGGIARLPSVGNVPYPILVFSGILPWQLLSSSMANASNSILNNSALIGKIYFPRMIVPCSAIVVSLIDFAVSFLVFIALLAWYQYVPDWRIITLPFFIVMALLAAVGPGLWIASLNVKYRDFRYVVPFIVQFGMYVSPVGFNSAVVPPQWQFIYSLNPAVGIIEGFRWALFGDLVEVGAREILTSWGIIILLLVFGLHQFRKMERSFADHI